MGDKTFKNKRLTMRLPHISKQECVLDQGSLDAIFEEAKNMFNSEGSDALMIIGVGFYTDDEIKNMPEFEGW